MQVNRLARSVAHRAADEIARRVAWRMDQPPVKPRQVIVDLTDRCFFRCPTCDKWRARRTSPELTAEAWERVLAALHAWLGPFHLSISGGEPLVRRDVLDIIAAASALGCTTNLMTNGWLVDDGMARSLVRAGLDNLTLSLNGLRPETHDATRGVEGSHARIVAAIAHFNQARRDLAPNGRRQPPTLSLNVIVAGRNAAELPDLVRWARNAGIDAVGLQPLVDASNYQPYRQRFRNFAPDWPAHSALWPCEPDEMDAAIAGLIDLKAAGYPVLNPPGQLARMRRYFTDPTRRPGGRCYVGLDNLLIDPYGDARLCYTMDVVGNVLRRSPRKLWRGAAAARVRRQIRSCSRGCQLLNCNYRPPLREQLTGLLHRLWSKSRS